MRHIPYHRAALSLSLIFQAEFQRKPKEAPYDDQVFDVLQKCVELAKWADTKKADFYARLQEAWQSCPPTGFLAIQAVVTRCLINCEDAHGI